MPERYFCGEEKKAQKNEKIIQHSEAEENEGNFLFKMGIFSKNCDSFS